MKISEIFSLRTAEVAPLLPPLGDVAVIPHDHTMCDCLDKILDHQSKTASLEYEQNLDPQEKPNEGDRDEYISRATEALSPWKDIIQQHGGTIPPGLRRRYHEDIANTLSDYMNEVHQSAQDGDTRNLSSLEGLLRSLSTHHSFPAQAHDLISHYLLHVHESGLAPEDFQPIAGIEPSAKYQESLSESERALRSFMKASTDATGRMTCPNCANLEENIRQASSAYRREVKPRSKGDITGGTPSSWVFNRIINGQKLPKDAHPRLQELHGYYRELLKHRNSDHITPEYVKAPTGLFIRMGGGADAASAKEVQSAAEDGAENVGRPEDSEFYNNLTAGAEIMPGQKLIKFPKEQSAWMRQYATCPNNPEHTDIYENITNFDNPEQNFVCAQCQKEARETKDPKERQLKMESASFGNPLLQVPRDRINPSSSLNIGGQSGAFSDEEMEALRNLFSPAGQNRWATIPKHVTLPGEVNDRHPIPSKQNRVIIPLSGYREIHLKNVPFEKGHDPEYNEGQPTFTIVSTPRKLLTKDPWSPRWDEVVDRDDVNVKENILAGEPKPYITGKRTRRLLSANPWLHGSALYLFDLAEKRSGWSPNLSVASDYMRDSANPSGATRPVFETRTDVFTTPATPETKVPAHPGKLDLHAFSKDKDGKIIPLIIDGKPVVVGTIDSNGEMQLKQNHEGEKVIDLPEEMHDESIKRAAHAAQQKSISKSFSNILSKAREMLGGEKDPSTGLTKSAPPGSFVDKNGLMIVDPSALHDIYDQSKKEAEQKSSPISKRTATRLRKKRESYIQAIESETSKSDPTKSGPVSMRSPLKIYSEEPFGGYNLRPQQLVYPTITPINVDDLRANGYTIDTLSPNESGELVSGERPQHVYPSYTIPEQPSVTRSYSRQVKVGDRPFDDAIDRKAFEKNIATSINLALGRAFPGMDASEARTKWKESWGKIAEAHHEEPFPSAVTSSKTNVNMTNVFRIIEKL
jgi:hypothetical protein